MKKETVTALVMISVFALFTVLLSVGKIDQWAYVALLFGFALVSFVLRGFSRLQELDLKNMRLILREMKEVEENVYVREEDLRKASITFAEMLVTESSFAGRFGSERSNEIRRLWLNKKIKQLFDELSVSNVEYVKVFRVSNAFAKLDKHRDSESIQEFERLLDIMEQETKSEISIRKIEGETN
jgi:hypothetical protein